MAQATGKSGGYRHYKCSGRMAKTSMGCKSRNMPIENLDNLILDALAERIFTPDRLNRIINELRKTVRDSRESGQDRVNDLKQQAKAAEVRLNRLYEAVERGLCRWMRR